MPNVPAFSKLGTWLKGHFRKGWYKTYTHKRNRKKLRQARDLQDHQDKRLDPWALD